MHIIKKCISHPKESNLKKMSELQQSSKRTSSLVVLHRLLGEKTDCFCFFDVVNKMSFFFFF